MEARMQVLRQVGRYAVPLTVGAYAVSLVPGVRSGDGGSSLWDVWVYAGALAASAVGCLARAVRVRTDRLPWTLVGLGLGSYATGTLVFYAFLRDRDPVPCPSVSDVLWLTWYPLAILAIGLMVRAGVEGSSRSVWLDGVVSGLGLASLSAAIVFPRVAGGVAGGPAAVVTNLAYPLLDLALLAAVVGGMATLGAWRQRPWRLLAGGFAVFSVADSWYLIDIAQGTYHAGSLVDLTYLVAAALVAEAAVTDPVPGRDRDSGQARSFLVPGAFALVAVAVLAVSTPGRSPLALSLAIGALLAAWLRTWVAVREVMRLSDSRRQARTDMLTGLPNRRAFYEVVQTAQVTRPVAGAVPAAIILTDLNGFKEINDALGHQLGDQLLQEVSCRFAALVPAGGTIARLGGDEMAMFVPGMTVASAAGLSRQLLQVLEAPFQIQDTSLHVGVSVGIAAVDPEDDPGQALAKADLAMYRAKDARTGWAVYDGRSDGDAWDRLATVEALREAFTLGGITIELQPINDARTARPSGMEALVRWNHPVRGRVAPDQFLPLAEKSGLMGALTRTVLDQSLTAAQRLQALGLRLPVSVNLSASDLLDIHLAEQVADALQTRGLRPELLHLEITESLFVDTHSSAIEQLACLRDLGIELVVDDYGTGYSCLAYLHNLPVSCLKIDRGFTQRVLLDRRTALIVASTIEMAHSLGLRVVAEGVETPEELDWLNDHGCDLAQGYLLGRPMGPLLLEQWLTARLAAPAECPAVGTP